MANELPSGYIKGVPRVSDIVSFVSPFEGTDWQARYRSWLKKVGVKEYEYMARACDTGTYIHQVMEDYVNGEPLNRNPDDNEEVKETINGWLLYIDSIKKLYTKTKGYTLVAEPVLRDKDNRFQWSSDLIVIHEGRKEIIVIDWKSFWIARSFFSLPNKYKKPYDKIKKGRLQFSLYWETYKQKGYTVKDLVLVYLHKDWAYPYSLEQYTTEELDLILEAYKSSKQNLEDKLILINLEDMFKLEISHPTVQYGVVKLQCDLKELDNWETVSETLTKMCKTVKVVSNEMKKDS